jgi:hypothetical protein
MRAEAGGQDEVVMSGSTVLAVAMVVMMLVSGGMIFGAGNAFRRRRSL